jgi:hypothetical protein
VNKCAECPGSWWNGPTFPSPCSEKCITDTCSKGLDHYKCSTECGYESPSCGAPNVSFFNPTIVNPQATPKAVRRNADRENAELPTMTLFHTVTRTHKSHSTHNSKRNADGEDVGHTTTTKKHSATCTHKSHSTSCTEKHSLGFTNETLHPTIGTAIEWPLTETLNPAPGTAMPTSCQICT